VEGQRAGDTPAGLARWSGHDRRSGPQHAACVLTHSLYFPAVIPRRVLQGDAKNTAPLVTVRQKLPVLFVALDFAGC